MAEPLMTTTKFKHWKYEFFARPGSRLKDVDAQRIGPILTKINARDGDIKPAAVVAEARNQHSPLHRYFEWNVRRAAEAHWRATARRLIGAVEIRVITEPRAKPKEMRAFVKIAPSIGYKPTVEAFHREDFRNMVLNRALEELEVWKKRYEKMIDFASIFQGAELFVARARRKLKAA